MVQLYGLRGVVNSGNGGDTVKCAYFSRSIILSPAKYPHHRWIPAKRATNTFEENHKDLDEAEVTLLPSAAKGMA